jgi:hypothetical protein
MDPSQTTRLTDATALGDVVQHGDHLRRLQLRATQRGSLPLRKPCCTGPAVQHAHLLVFPRAHADGQVVSTALAIVMALLMVTAKPCEIVHRFPSTCTSYLGHRLLSVAKICQ